MLCHVSSRRWYNYCVKFFKRIKILLVLLALASLPLLYHGCGAPAGPPAPPVETPSPVPIKFVEYGDVQINFSTIGTTTGAASIVDKIVGIGPLTTQITIGPTIQKSFEDWFVETMNGLSALEIPASDTTTTFEGTITRDPAVGAESVKIDFGDYDLDGDGPEGCSGHTAALPVCARIWIDAGSGYERYIAWVFDELPSADNPGRSRYKMYFRPIAGVDVSTAIFFNHVDPEDRTTEVFATATVGEDVAEPGVIPGSEGRQHFEALQVGPEESALKTLNLNQTDVVGGVSSAALNYLGRYIEGEDFWAGSVEGLLLDAFGLAPLDDACARLSTADFTGDPAACEDLGISVAGIPFVDPATPGDVAIPTDFPAAPTF